MAAQTNNTLNRILAIVRSACAWLLLIIGTFMAIAWIGSSIPRNSDWTEPDNGVTIMIETNGVHTAIVMPKVTAQKDWREDFPTSDIKFDLDGYTHVSVSWGEREVFLNTQTWADITPSTVLGAATGGDSLLHIAHYFRPAPADYIRPLTISEAQYAALVAEIEASILPANQRETYPGYGGQDVFYDAPGTYHFANTCNQWVSDTLAAAGIKTGWWTPFAGGVMKWVPEVAE